jgi:aminocarboxymuconate-semialdehyde decarboxylase
MMGSDYPFPLGDLEFGKYMEDEMDLSKADREQIFHGSALSWLGLSAEQFD